MTDFCPAENIYNLIPREQTILTKAPRYTSTFREYVREESKKNKSLNRTMGPAKVEVPSPKEFLHKNSKEPKVSERKSDRCMVEETRRPPVPRRTEQPIMGVQTKKNFINTNAADAIMGVPKKPEHIFVDSRKGDKHPLETSGLVPKYIKRKDYGVTPEYLCKRNEEVRRAQEEYDTYVRERIKQGAMKQISDEERESVLEGLKKNWDELHHEYQGLSVVIDTTPKKMHKERLEIQMRQLERDIELIERHRIIYIANN
ncbi:enkurin [Ambystoma mexicanum]|uniref:enkurin n=1 Tax=Ambystoma mexicanum TaxID=8296 RepID=UPI0037E8BB33